MRLLAFLASLLPLILVLAAASWAWLSQAEDMPPWMLPLVLMGAMLVITHYQRLLEYIVPDFVHVLADGRIVRSGGKELALELEEKGYGWIEESAGAIA